MTAFDWSRFTVRINIRARQQDLYTAWSTPAALESWFLRDAIFRTREGTQRAPDEPVTSGDTYTWFWHGWPDETKETGEILSANGKDALSFRFGEAGICTIRIYPYQDEQIVELVQQNIPTDERSKQNWHLGCKTGWTFYLANLKSIMEGGVDLRNKDLALGESLNK
jgi:uncharacterized protein YndB with AHSA1/START domain